MSDAMPSDEAAMEATPSLPEASGHVLEFANPTLDFAPRDRPSADSEYAVNAKDQRTSDEAVTNMSAETHASVAAAASKYSLSDAWIVPPKGPRTNPIPVVVAHVTPIKMMVEIALDAPLAALYRMELLPGSLTTIAWWRDGNCSMRGFAESAHLRGLDHHGG